MTAPPTLAELIDAAAAKLDAANLTYGHGAIDAREDATFLLLETLDLSEDILEQFPDTPVSADDSQRYHAIIETRILTRKPSPYLVKRAWLVGVPFYVDERVIVPRSFIAEIMADGLFDGGDFALIDNPGRIERVLDLCTGSGCLAILAADVFPNATIDAIDLSPDALDVARINVDMYGLQDRINLLQGDLFAPVAKQRYDIILTNPPYVSSASMQNLPLEYRHEPALALAGGADDGMDLVARILAGAADYLEPHGGIMTEIGGARRAIEQRYPNLPFSWLETTHSEGEVFWLTADAFQKR